jgi:RES domain-containing protein
LNLTAWRVVKQRFAAAAFDGEGARLFGGRWNSAGRPVVYTAATTSLALLEILVNADAGLLPHYVTIPVTFDERLVERVAPEDLPEDWRTYPAPFALKRIGDAWLDSARSCALRVPSAVVPHESNYLLNPTHGDFASVLFGEPITLESDTRLR